MSSNDWSKLVVNPLFKFYMEQFFSNPAPQYVNEEKLIELVAIRTRNLADEILAYSDLSADEALNENERQVIILLGELRTLVYNHNNPTLRTSAVFADFVAQVIMFCLLYAHRVVCSNDDSPAIKAEKIKAYAFNDVANDAELIPFHDLMIYLRNNKGTSTFIGQWIDECVAFLSFVKMTEHQLANPDYHRLFELFLSKFDKQARFDYGAYYTPKKLADFIVRLTNKIANEFFDGATIYDDGNTIIDPCCGTGSFLEQVAEHDDNNGVYNLCGFEILPAPYMLANYRMALVKSKNKHFKLKSHIILANTLSNCLLGADVNEDSIEVKELVRADKLSSMPLKLIIGNPPCSDSNRENVSDDFSEIIRLTNDFRPPAENRRGRQNIQKQVNNPFMLFLSWSCEKLLNSNNHSILAFIVPLSFLEAESYKYARKYLLEKFSKLWAIAIDADARTGIRGDSMFKTLQGRAVIILLRKFGDSSTVSKVNFLDISRNKRIVKEEILDRSIDETFHLFESFSVSDTMYSFMPTRPFNQELYSSFWPISSENNKPAIFLNQCSGAKMAPTALLTHVKKQMLKRRSKEIANDGIDKANEWIGGQDKKVVDDKIIAFQNALRTCSSGQQLEDILNENIIPCSFRPFVNSNALLWKRIFEYQTGVGGGGARIRPEIKAVYSIKDTTTVGFSLAHAPKDLDESLGQFASFCWYFPDNDLSRRGNGHIYLNQYIRDTKTNEVVTNINSNLLSKLNHMTGISPKELARKMVFYSYAIFCSQVYLEEFYGALFVVNQSESRAKIPIVNDSDIFYF